MSVIESRETSDEAAGRRIKEEFGDAALGSEPGDDAEPAPRSPSAAAEEGD
jgi:hypothetical protein